MLTKFGKKIEEWGLKSLKINIKIAELEFSPTGPDRAAAWDLYVELMTRVTTQPLSEHDGDEKTALDSVYSLFGLTRDILKERGRGCLEFTRISVVILNQVVRPFTSKWHKKSLAGAFQNTEECKVFRSELESVQKTLRNYTKLLADLAQVEDLSVLELIPEQASP